MTMQVRYHHEKPISKLFGNFNINIGKEQIYIKIKKAIEFAKKHKFNNITILIYHKHDLSEQKNNWFNEKMLNTNWKQYTFKIQPETKNLYKLTIYID